MKLGQKITALVHSVGLTEIAGLENEGRDARGGKCKRMVHGKRRK